MSTKDNKYNYKISNLRAIAILVVVFGHSIIIFDRSWNYYSALYSSPVLENIKHFINLFQMPLFVFISGYCFFYSKVRLKKGSLGAFVKSKAKRLLIPFVGFSVFWMIPIRLLSHYPYWEGLSVLEILKQVFLGKDSGHLWFCPALFLIMIMAGLIEVYILSKAKNTNICLLILLSGLCLVSIASPIIPGVLFIRDLAKYSVWFYLGYYVNYRAKDKSDHALYMLIFAIAVMCSSALGLLDSIGMIKYFVDYLGAAVFIVGLFSLMPSKGNARIEAVSKNSFGVYLFHSPMIYIVFCYYNYLKPVTIVLINFIILFTIAFLLTNLMRKSRIGRLLIGE